MSISKLLIANRGEIAVRINRAAQALGISTVQVVSRADRDMLAAQLADEVIEIGPAPALRSYLSIPAILDAARRTGADAIHPGYGFLAENAAFAQSVEDAGLIFVGPKAAIIRQMGDKISALTAAREAGVPTLPGSDGSVADSATARAIAHDIGYPVMIKATAGGGGRGIRVARNETQLEELFAQAMQEAASAFGNGSVYLERMIEYGRHIEVQVLGDGHDVIHLYERDCSVQRRRQKVWEEAPATCLSPSVRAALCQSAVNLARQVGYNSAGTVEYLYDQVEEKFYFLEMNTRIQVEHPVTEMVTGVDIVVEMLRIADGERLHFKQSDIHLHGHAIECRINAEDPERNFLPAPGQVKKLVMPQGTGVRVDTFLYEGYTVPPFYDSLVAKIIVHADQRAQTLATLRKTLDSTRVEGFATTLPLHVRLAGTSEVATATYDTGWLERWLSQDQLLHGSAMS
ncbi:acetyl-CoA carboxylase biotin carboxylase subunit [Komagataeibacter sp. FXV3]|uniref:acetyl-CoA carboxylase biotin carboxylase subunit n=1 Tax=Komagataeibacter sp. FXV3 TaxID=2608998 RepID=UPI00187BA83F|nr:acetyl-CoA carboxylase biotin carboxylase subunit [Komagataeibacter sp. FXV3]MBE7728275.1 acetyl-CoA carboxylase biotin carboxylase subunit [Komagataeibacter sp. FXV3]